MFIIYTVGFGRMKMLIAESKAIKQLYDKIESQIQSPILMEFNLKLEV